MKFPVHRISSKKQMAIRFFTTLGLSISPTLSAMAGDITITNFGHSSLLIEGSGKKVLLNPFKAVGCANGLNEPRVSVDVILASSNLADEGARTAKGTFLVEPGSYRLHGLKIEGFASPHDRVGGRRFGNATLWRWEQGGLSFAHLGSTAGKLNGEGQVLLGRPDVLVIGVGGGAKVYNGEEAAAIIKRINPKNVIPVQYLNRKAPKNCDLTGLKPFLEAMKDIKTNKPGKILKLANKSGEEMVIHLMD